MRRLAVLVALVTLVVASGTALAETSAGSVSIRLLDAPSNRQDDPRARIYIVDHLHQGDRIERHIELANGTDGPLHVRLYPAAAKVADGEFRFGEGHAANDLTRWTTVAPAAVDVAPHGTATATVTITVPGDATDGERYGVVWAELPASGGTAAVVNRVGVRMYLSVGEGQEPTTDFRIGAPTAARDADGKAIVRTPVPNTRGPAN